MGYTTRFEGKFALSRQLTLDEFVKTELGRAANLAREALEIC